MFAVRDYDAGGVTELSGHRQHVVAAVEQTEAITPAVNGGVLSV
jgi:hypothetical protein